MNTKLYRSRSDKMLAGVCGGLGQYLAIDSTFVRLFFILLGFAGQGAGVLIYLLLWILLPVEGEQSGWRPTFGQDASFEKNVESGAQQFADRARAMGDDIREAVTRPNPQSGIIIGGALILLGLLFFVQNLNVTWLRWLNFDVLWPLLLIAGGGVLLFRYRRGA
jgi:phage shock protein C